MAVNTLYHSLHTDVDVFKCQSVVRHVRPGGPAQASTCQYVAAAVLDRAGAGKQGGNS